MKNKSNKNIVTKCLASMALIFSINSYYAQVPTTNLKGYWPMEGNSQDYSGNNNNGNNTGAVLTTDRFNRTGGAFEFHVNNSIAATVNVPNSASLQVTKPFSISLWCMNYGKSMTLFRKAGDWGIDFGNSTGESFGGYLSVFAKNSAGSVEVKTTATSFPINTWMHVVAVFDNTTSNNLKLYVNNSLVLTSTISSTSGISTHPVTIGSYNTEIFTGKLDEVRLYKQALTTSQITALYNDQPHLTNVTVWDNSTSNGLVFCNNSTYTTTNITLTHTLPIGTNVQYYLVNSAGTSYACGGSTLSASPSTVSWNIPSTVPSGNGYTLKIKSTNPVFEYTHPTFIDVYTQASPVISNVAPVNLCSGNSLTLNSSSSFSSTVYTWKKDNIDVPGFNSYSYPANLNVTNAGTYAAYYYDPNGCVVKSNNVVVNSIAKPTPVIAGNTEVCSGAPSILDAGAGYASYVWSNGSTNQQITAAPGTYSVTVTNSLGCSGTASKTITNSTACTSLPCGASFNYMTAQIFASTPSISASQIKNYIFRLYNLQSALVGSYTTTANNFALQQLPNIKYNTSYKWSAQIEYYTSTGTAFAPESTPCPMTMLAPATTVPCDTYYPGLNSYVTVTPPSTNSTSSQIVNYKFNFYNTSGYNFTSKTQASNTLYLASVSGLYNNDDFMWSVQIQYVNGTSLSWGPESTPCLLMLGGAFRKAHSNSITNNEVTVEPISKVKKCCLDSEIIYKHDFKIYPNPVLGGKASIDLNEENTASNIYIKDFTGRNVLEIRNVNEKVITINTSHIERGIYVVVAEIEGEVLTERLIVE